MKLILSSAGLENEVLKSQFLKLLDVLLVRRDFR